MLLGFVDIDLNSAVVGEGDVKLWVVKVELLGYAQMDTQWHDQARNPDHHGKPSYETVPVLSHLPICHHVPCTDSGI